MATATIAALAGIFILLVLSALFSGSETALTAASQPRMHLLEQEGDRRARLVNRLFDQRDRMIGAILLGNNLVNILASALATSVMIQNFGDAGVLYATVSMTLLVLIFGEVMPKTYAFRNADKVALGVSPLMQVIVALLSPITHGIHAIISAILRPFGIHLGSEQELRAAEEALRGAIDLHRGEEPAMHQERIMLRSILELSEADVDEVMQNRQDIVMIDADMASARIVEQMLESPYTRIPLWRGEKDNIVGVLHAKDVLRTVQAHRDVIDNIDIMEIALKPWFIPESTSLLDQLQAFRQRHEHFALVVDEYGSLMGVVTLEDIIEEIVGEISDEHDITRIGIRPMRDGSIMVDGKVTIRDLNRSFEWNLPDQDAATIAGFVIHQAKVIPEVGRIFSCDDFRFEVIRRRHNRITSIRITPPSEPAPKS